LTQPSILLLDEPTRSLDPLAASRMREMIRTMPQQDPPVSILFTSHNLSEVETLCARVAVISKGEIRAIDSPQNLRRQTSVSEKTTVIAAGIPTAKAGELFGSEVQVETTNGENEVTKLSFTRQVADNQLDNVIRLLHHHNARVLDVETERATLLDLLESFEEE
jgi:ABC-2 type transport system ATP-binding protein